MENERVERLIEAFSRSRRSEVSDAWQIADSMGGDLMQLLAQAFPRIRKSEGRASVLRYAGRFSRESDTAFRMGMLAVQDRAYAVRHYGCASLAYSLREDSLPSLVPLLKHPDRRTVEDAKAAIDAIKNRNHNFFKDRRHTGKILWEYASV